MLVSTAGHIALFPLLYQPAGQSYNTQSQCNSKVYRIDLSNAMFLIIQVLIKKYILL